MPSASALRQQIEATLADRIPSALTPVPRMMRPVASSGIAAVDELLEGGFPIGAITEISGPECSGRSTLAFSFLAQRTQEGKVCAWIDVSNTFQPETAVACRLDLARLLWVRCGAVSEPIESAKVSVDIRQECLTPPLAKKGVYAGGWGAHPRDEARGIAEAMGSLVNDRRSQSIRRTQQLPLKLNTQGTTNDRRPQPVKPWTPLDQALRTTDLLLQGGGFSVIVLDMGSVSLEYSSRVPLATWFRYRAAAERTQSSIILLSQHPCAKSSVGLALRLGSAEYLHEQSKVFTELRFRIDVDRQRFVPASNVVPLRKGPQRQTGAQWKGRCIWAGCR